MQVPEGQANAEDNLSPYARDAWKYIERGFSVIPIAPGTKKPGEWSESRGWTGMPKWARYCDRLPTEHELPYFYKYPDAGIGLALGKFTMIIGLDRDYNTKGTDALEAIIPYSPVKKRGEKGYTAFFRYNGERSCSFNINGVRVLDILSDGRQTVLPPSLHPVGFRYVWITEDTLTTIDSVKDLPLLPDDFIDQVKKVLAPFQTDEDKKYQSKKIAPDESETPIHTGESEQGEYFRDLNSAALAQLDQWVVRLIETAKPKQGGGYRCKATWRNVENANVGIDPTGIRDWGGGYGMTPLDLVMQSRQCNFMEAAGLLRECITMQEPDLTDFWMAPAPANEDEIPDTPAKPPSTPPKAVMPWWVAKSPPATTEPPVTITIPTETSSDDVEEALPAFITNPPGMLGEITRWINSTAPKEQPELALAAAIALGSVVMARTYCTQFANFTSLYLVMVAKSTEGKEHPQSCVEKILVAAGLEHLLGGSGYTSAGGVHTALLRSPAHIVLIDEMGKMLKLSRSRGNSNSEAAVDKLVEVFGRLNGVMRPPTYSNLSNHNAKGTTSDASDKIVHYPAITILGATTPSTFYDNLSDDLVKDGFLGRCIVVESSRPRQLTRWVDRTEPPQHIVDWCKAVHKSEAFPESDDLARITAASIQPVTILMPMTDDCMPLLRAVELAMNREKDATESTGLDAVLGRTVEKASRVSLIVSKMRDQNAKEVTRPDLAYSLDFIRYYDMRLVAQVQTRRYESELHRELNKVMDLIRGAVKLSKTMKDKKYKAIMETGGMPHSLLLQRMNITSKRLTEITDTLIASEQIQTRGVGPMNVYFTGKAYWIYSGGGE